MALSLKALFSWAALNKAVAYNVTALTAVSMLFLNGEALHFVGGLMTVYYELYIQSYGLSSFESN